MTGVAVVGAGGYTGQELLRLLAGHPEAELVGCFGSESRQSPQPIGDVAPALRGVVDRPVGAASPEAIVASGAEAVFLATPHEVSAHLAGPLLDAGLLVVDLSAAFRFPDPAAYPVHYGFAHPAPALLGTAVYGMPERSRAGLSGARLVACAGCYVTAASIPLHALVSAGVVKPGATPIIDATSGVSGAGRGGKAHTSFCEVSMSPYGPLKHRHRPEIERAVGVPVVFQPHLGAYDRGILATIHVATRRGVDAGAIGAAFGGALGAEPFVRLLGDATAGCPLPTVKAVERTNFVDLAWAFEPTEDGGHLIVFSALDNLTKGASGQALQCLNAVMGWPETLGLLPGAARGWTGGVKA